MRNWNDMRYAKHSVCFKCIDNLLEKHFEVKK